MAVQLSSSYMRRSFQLLAKLSPDGITNEEAFERAGNIIYEWAKYKFWKVFRQLPYKKETLYDKRDGNEIGIIYDSQNSLFVLRLVHPDSKIPGRMWITDVEITKYNGDFVLAVRLSVSSLQSCTEDIPYSPPVFLGKIVDNIGVSDVIKITGLPHILSTQEDIHTFLAFLENPHRNMPAVLVTPHSRIEDSMEEQYLLDPVQMAHDLSGTAHVFQITQDVNSYFTECIGKQWSAFNGAVRTYYPGISFEDANYYQHPLISPRSILMRDFMDSDDPDYCLHEIEDYVKNYVLARRIAWEDNGVDFYLVANQRYLREQRPEGFQALLSSYLEQIDQLQKQCDENLSLADSYAKDYEIYQEECERQRQLIGQLKAQVSTLRFQLQERGDVDNCDIPENGTYSDISDWIAQYFPDRLLLSNRAARSLKSACYEDVALVYKCLKLLATSYYDYRTGEINYDKFMDACSKVDPGLGESGAITDVAAGMQGDTYYIQYHGKRRKLDRHLTKGSNKDRRYCLRIYYFWDEQDQTVVIGDLPHHLDTSAT